MLRRHEPADFWQSVTGSLRWGESAAEAAAREADAVSIEQEGPHADRAEFTVSLPEDSAEAFVDAIVADSVRIGPVTFSSRTLALTLDAVGGELYGEDFVQWMTGELAPGEVLYRIADEAGVVLMPGRGFGDTRPSARVSLANLNESDYAAIGKAIRNLLDDYYAERADFAFGSYRYFPGAGRRYFLEYRYAP